MRRFFFFKISVWLLFSTLKTVGLFAQKSGSRETEKLWPIITARLDERPADTSRQFILELVRGHCGSNLDCQYLVFDDLRDSLERRFDLATAIFVCQQMAVVAEQDVDLDRQGHAHRNIFRYFRAMGNHQKAIHALEKAKDCFEQAGNNSKVMYCKISFLEITSQLRPFEEFYPAMCSLVSEAAETRDTANLIGLHIRLLGIIRQSSRIELAKKHIDAIENLVPHLDRKASYWYGANTTPLRGRAEIAVEKHDFTEAKRLYLSILQFCEQEPDRWGEIKALTNLAQMDWKLRDNSSAKNYLDKAEKKALALNLHDLLERVFELKSEIAETEGRFADALEAKKKSLFHEAEFEKKSEGFSLQAHYLELEKEKLTVEKAKNEVELKLKTAQLIASAIILLLAFLLAGGLFRAFRFQKNAGQKLAEQNDLIQKQAEQLKNLDAAKSRFFANVSHELRTPLTLLLGPIKSLLQENNLTEKQAKLLGMAKKSGGQLENLVNEILDLRKLEVGKLDLDEKPTVLRAFFQNYFAQFESLAERKRIIFLVDITFSNDLTALIDREKCRQIVYNLLSNAFKFTQEGGQIAVNLLVEKGELRLRVADNGSGIHADDLPHIFDRFFQTNRPEKQAEGGTGIGLNLCHEYAQLFGGSVSVESSVGEGSIFQVVFPVKLVENLALKHEKAAPLVEPETNQILPFLIEKKAESLVFDKKPTILLVEDNLGLQDYIGLILFEKYEVMAAENGQAALEKLKKFSPSLILSDLMMPVMDGFQLLEKLKSDDATRHIPVVMLTARAEISDKLKALRIGVDDYLFKPFDEEELLARIENLLKNQAARRSEILVENEKNEVGARPIFSEEDKIWLEGFELFARQKMASDLLSVPSLAQHFLMSESTLLRQLKRLTGLSPLQYLQEMRLDEARRLLENRRFNSIAQVAAQVGFGDAKAFSRSFRQRFGKSPTDFLED